MAMWADAVAGRIGRDEAVKNAGRTAIPFGFGIGAATAGGIDCAQPLGAKPQAQMAYLQGERSLLNDACMIYAMDQLAAAAVRTIH